MSDDDWSDDDDDDNEDVPQVKTQTQLVVADEVAAEPATHILYGTDVYFMLFTRLYL